MMADVRGNETMNEQELQETMERMRALGLQTEVCDVDVPVMSVRVVCGTPKEIYEAVAEDYYMIPKRVAGHHAHVAVIAEGNSMVDAGIMPGDRLEVELCEAGEVREGDIVVAEIDGVGTVKEIYTDEEGTLWLLPYNENYDAIEVSAESQLRIFGRVVGVVSRPAISTGRERAAKVRKARAAKRKRITTARIEAAIICMGEQVEHARQWYAVMRAMVDAGAFEATDYAGFVEMVHRLLPEHGHLPVGAELRRMAVQSFARQVALWDNSNAPVTGQRFDDYLRIARATQQAL